MATLIDADPWTCLSVMKGVLTQDPPAERNPLLDVVFNCANNGGAGQFKTYASFDHDTEGNDYTSTFGTLATIAGTPVAGNVITTATMTVYALMKVLRADDPVFHIPEQSDWVRYSDKNGDFITSSTTLNKDNLKGEFPMEIGGTLYYGKKLGNGVAIYGKNGMAIVRFSGLLPGKQTIKEFVGLKSKHSIAGDDNWHLVLDRTGILWEVFADGSMKDHDYSNHLAAMSSATVMNKDPRKKIVYICDGTRGYVWTPWGLGQCPPNITGLGYRNGVFYVTAPSAITNPPFVKWTDIWDGGSREDKEVMRISLSIALSGDFYGAIAYRWNKQQAFNTTPWVKADYGGVVNVRATGIEFMFGYKVLSYIQTRIDQVEIEVAWEELKPLVRT